jgi:O-antigen/teichoic acid export membrane protein
LGCFFAAMLGMFFIPIILGNQVAAAGGILWILVVGAVISFPTFVGYIPYVHQISATYIGTPMAIGAAVTNLIANYLLIPRYGLIGCAWATVLSISASLLIVFALVHIRHQLKHRWTLLALLPVIFACSWFSWTGNLLYSILIVLVTSLLLVAIYRDSIGKMIKLLHSYRGAFSS